MNGCEKSISEPIVATLREDGAIVRVNEAWETFGARNGLSPDYEVVGENYFTVTRQANDEYADHVATGLREVANGNRASFTAVYPCHGPDEERWFRLYAMAVVDESLIIVVHRRITDPETDSRWTETSDAHTETPRSGENLTRLVTKRFEPDETGSERISTAFEALGIEIHDQETVLQDWVDTDAIDILLRDCTEFELTVSVWDYPVVVTPETVIIYAPPSDS